MIRMILAVMLLAVVQNAQTWYQVEVNYNPEFYHPGAKGVFLDKLNGWCTNGYLYKTTNGGLDWYRVEFDTSHFTVIGYNDLGLGISSTADNVYKTTDYGNTWKLLPGASPFIVAVDFTDSLTSVICSMSSSSKYSIQCTLDGGDNWVKSVTPHPDSIEIRKFQLLQNGIGWAFGIYKRGGIVLKSTDSGLTWETKLNYREGISGGFFLNPSFGVAVVYKSGESLYITHDGGNTWNSAFVNEYNKGTDIFFLNDSLGWCLAGQYLFKTVDSGENWTQVINAQMTGFDGTLQNIGFLPDKSFGYAFGSEGVLLVYDTNPSSVETDLEIPDEYSLSQNYPNPFNPSTIIKYDLPENIHILIKLYDILGREVKILVDDYKTAGYHHLTMYKNGLKSGVYFYRIQAGNFTATRKMVFLQ